MSRTDTFAWLTTPGDYIQCFGVILYRKSSYRSVYVANGLLPLVVNEMSELLNTVLHADTMYSTCRLHWVGQRYVLFDHELSLCVAHHIAAEECEIYRVEGVVVTICSVESSNWFPILTLK